MNPVRRWLTTVGTNASVVACVAGFVLVPAAGSAQTGWQQQTLPALEPGVTYVVSDVKALSVNEVWIAGSVTTGESVILKTLDGATWNLMFRKGDHVDPWQAFRWPFNRLSVVDSNHAWTAGTYGSTAFTTDGGATWSHESAPCPGPAPSAGGTIMHNYGLKAVTATNVWAAGWDRYDYGLIWHRPYSGSCADWFYWPYRQEAAYGRATVLAIDASDASNAWAVGYPGIVHTTDGGGTWVTEVASPPGLLADVDVVSPTVAWAVGANGLILKTTNGGADWGVQGSGVAENLTKISAVNADVAWAVGGNGTILKTIDGGATWRSQVSGTTASFVGVAAASATTAWAVGDGIVIATTDGGTYQPLSAPDINGVSPTGAPIAGGTAVTVGGRDFRPGIRIYIGGVLATRLLATAGYEGYVTAPAHAAGLVDVTVINPDGQSATLANAFAYADTQPLLVGLSPSYGYLDTEVEVEVRGAGLTPAAGTYDPVPTVNINGTPVAGRGADYDKVIVVFARGLLTATGMANITVTTAAGTSNSVPFTVNYGSVSVARPSTPPYNKSVTVQSLSGPVQATFYGLNGNSWIRVGKVFERPQWGGSNIPPPAGYVFLAGYYYEVATGTPYYKSATICFPYAQADVPVGFSEAKLRLMRRVDYGVPWEDVTFTLDTSANMICGTTSGLATRFAIAQGPVPVPPPVIMGIEAAIGPPAGGTTVTISGSMFQPNAAVTFGGVAATTVTVVSGMTMTATLPAHALGFVDVVVTNPDAQSSTSTAGFEYVGRPTVAAVVPGMGVLRGYTAVTITGTGFRGGDGGSIKFGGTQLLSYTLVNDTTITGYTPSHAAGLVDVVVTNADGQSGTLVNGFMYVPLPTVTNVVPNAGPITGGTPVTVTGTDFQSGATVTIGVAATEVVVVSSTTITAVTPARAAGTYSVLVTNPDTQSGIRYPGFTYGKAMPVITWANPAAITSGTALSSTQLNATANVDGAFVYSPLAGAVLAVGTQTLSVTFTPTDTTNYTTATKTVTITVTDVTRITPVITWANPAAITHGTALSSTQLNATADVNGVFVYSPLAGAVLAVGTQTLSVTFTPTDTTHYTTATKTVPIIVMAASATLTLSPGTLAFAGTNTNGTLGPLTPPQTVTVGFSAPTAVSWTATASQSWVQVTGGAGTGSGTFTVGIINPADVLAGVTQTTATVTVTAPGASNSPRTVVVNLALRAASATTGPVGLVDTPLPNTTGVVGTIGVTGWVVDDVGVVGVKVYRNCLAFEPAANCVTVAGRPVVFVGDATLVTGARPDVEALYPNLPQANRAAWGYLLLTNLLPHVPHQQMFGGQGAMTFSALATDVEGKQVWLGRTTGDTTATTITLANDTIAKPFGAIDTPAQGATVSGTFANFGWALTPDGNTTGDEAGDIVVPTDGSTLRVYLDGVPGATIAYNQCRGTTAAGPVPAGVWCNDDVASIFGHPTPQATFAARAANATPHRNLDVGRGAIGALLIDTTTLANGVHTIMWGVTDSAGRGEGLGSRYFTVLNAGADAPATPTPPAGDDGATPAYGLRPTAHGRTDAFEDTPGLVRARMGLDPNAPFAVVPADEAGVRTVRIPDLGRLELHVGAVDAGYLVANGERRDLPPGSHLDASTGIFTWAPGVGYLGTYRIVFVRAGQQIPVDVTIAPVRAVAPGDSEVRMALDLPVSGATVAGALRVAGWALDPQAAFGSGIEAVHVWAQRTDIVGAEPQFLGAAALGGARPDVAAVYGPQFGTPAFDLTTAALAPGQYEVTAYVRSARTGRWEDARTASVTVR